MAQRNILIFPEKSVFFWKVSKVFFYVSDITFFLKQKLQGFFRVVYMIKFKDASKGNLLQILLKIPPLIAKGVFREGLL